MSEITISEHGLAMPGVDDREGGWIVEINGYPRWYCWEGGTGDCWNIASVDQPAEDDYEQLHICDLDEFIAVLTALRDSEAHKRNVERWQWPKRPAS